MILIYDFAKMIKVRLLVNLVHVDADGLELGKPQRSSGVPVSQKEKVDKMKKRSNYPGITTPLSSLI
jgi:hypothetical protein